MSAGLISFRLPAPLYADLQALATEEQTDPVTMVARLIEAARQRRAWQTDLAALRQQIRQDGGLQIGNTKDEVVEQLRQARRQIFEAEYAHLY
jgi:hypothetical protein